MDNPFVDKSKHYPLPSVPKKLPEFPSGKNAEHDFRIDNSFPTQGSVQPASSGSQSTAPDAPTTPEGNMAGSATQKAFQRGDYKNGTYNPQ